MDDSGGLHVTTRVLEHGRRRQKRRVRGKSNYCVLVWNNLRCLTLRREEGSHEPRNDRQTRMHPLLEPPENRAVLPTLWFSPMSPAFNF